MMGKRLSRNRNSKSIGFLSFDIYSDMSIKKLKDEKELLQMLVDVKYKRKSVSPSVIGLLRKEGINIEE